MQAPRDDQTVLILGGALWADTTAPPQAGHGLAVAGGRIVTTGPNRALRERFPGAPVVDAGDCVITPAFINAHHHMYGVLAHGIPLDRAPAGFWPFLEEFWWPLVEDQLDHELIAAATDWACLEMVRSGVTTFYDCLEAPQALPGALAVEAEVVRRWGLRGLLSFEATQRVSAENGELGLRENADFFDGSQARDDLVSGMICFHTTFTCSEAFIRRAFGLAAERGARVHMHLAEGTYEPDYCLREYGLRTVAYYDRLGLLGPQVLASQCVQVDDDEIEILARRGVHVSHQPLSNCEVGGGFAPVPEMLAAGVNVALGTDGYINNFFEVMRAAALIPKARLLDPATMPAGTVWTMATQNGARALGFHDLGSLVAGNQADLLLIRADLPTPLAPHNTADQLLLWRNPGDLRAVMCAGRWLLWEGRAAGVDEEAVRRRVNAAAHRLWQAQGTG
ncbi:MAG: amidohydrolase [Anaerolineae bacterium]|jgi:cytosine/adenosine deaminase-related metal-dependent hydrolase